MDRENEGKDKTRWRNGTEKGEKRSKQRENEQETK